ncbi:hypothetical protein SBA2_840028 [Acidobacteriia bacterium SbA2]|nr:hypothetical protein SBA2_840028 [Acidobacteriia bacterium SbA2]
MAGVGKITAVDSESVGEEDLNCDSWFRQEQRGLNRAEAAGALSGLASPSVAFHAVQVSEGSGQVPELPEGCDVAVLCRDHFNPAEYELFNLAALASKTTWISARLSGFEFQIGPTVLPGETPCFQCFTLRLKSNLPDYSEYVLVEEFLKNHRLREETLAITPGAGLLALEVLKAITWFMAPATHAHLYSLNLLTLQSRLHPILKVPRCPSCGRPAMPRPQAGLHLPTPVDAGPSSAPSGEYRAPVRLAREGAGTGLERIPDSHPRPGFGQDGNGDDAAGGLQDLSGGCLDGPGRGGVRPGSLAPGALESRLAAATGALRAHLHAGDRRGWLLRPGGLQRRAAFRIKGRHGVGRTAFLARPPPGRQAPQSPERRVTFSPSGGLLLRRGKPYHPGSGRRSAGRGEPGVSAVSRNRQRLRGDATLRRPHAAFSHAVLWGSLGWEADLGPPDAWPGAGPAQEPLLCRPVRFRPLSVSAGDQPGR